MVRIERSTVCRSLERRPPRRPVGGGGDGVLVSFAISMEEARIIARLRRGEREALAGLQEEWRDAVWTLCLAMTSGERDAQALVQGVWKTLREEARTWSAHAPLSCQVAGLVCRVIARRLNLPQPGEAAHTLQVAERVVAAHELRAVLDGVPAELRLVFLADLFFACPVDALSEFVAVPEAALREARAAVCWRLVPRDRVDARAWGRELALLPDYVADDLSFEAMERVSAALDADASLEALADQLVAARETCRAVLESKAPTGALPIEGVTAAELRDPLGAFGGLLLSALVVLTCLVFSLGGGAGRAADALSGVLAGHAAALGRAPAFVATSDPETLARSLRGAGVSPASAEVGDWGFLRLRLKGGLPLPSGGPGSVALYNVDGRPLSITNLGWLADPGPPTESWDVAGARLVAYDLGDSGVVVLHERATGRVSVFTSAMPAEQLLALLAYGLKLRG